MSAEVYKQPKSSLFSWHHNHTLHYTGMKLSHYNCWQVADSSASVRSSYHGYVTVYQDVVVFICIEVAAVVAFAIPSLHACFFLVWNRFRTLHRSLAYPNNFFTFHSFHLMSSVQSCRLANGSPPPLLFLFSLVLSVVLDTHK